MRYTVRILTLYGDVLVESVGGLDEALALAGDLDSDLGSTLALVEVLDQHGERIAAEVDPHGPEAPVVREGSGRGQRSM